MVASGGSRCGTQEGAENPRCSKTSGGGGTVAPDERGGGGRLRTSSLLKMSEVVVVWRAPSVPVA